MKYSLLPILLMFISVISQATDWVIKKDDIGIRVSQQATGSGYPITRGTVEIDSSSDAVISLMRDHPVCYRWLFGCKQSRLIQQYDAQSRLDYVVLKSPYLFADRDMYLYTVLTVDRAAQSVLIRLSGRDTHDAGQPGLIRIKDMQGFWRMQTLPNLKTAVTYQVYNNPQLPPSAFLSNYLVGSVFQTLKNLRLVAQESKYRNAQLDELK